MGIENEAKLYEEVDTLPVTQEVGVKDVNKFIEAMLRFFTDKGTLYVSSYDFGYWADRLSCFRSPDRVRLKTSWASGAFLENGFAITDEFNYVFLTECVRNIDARRTFNQFLVYREGQPLLQCCSNFDDVFVNTKVPQSVIKPLVENGVVAFWNK